MSVKRSVPLACLCLASAAICVHALPKSPPHITGTVDNPDGSPAAGADVKLFAVDYNRHKSALVQEATTDKTGKFDLPPFKPSDFGIGAGIGMLVTGQQGVAVGYPIDSKPIKLSPTTSIRVQVRGADGKPVPGIRLYPRDFIKDHMGAEFDYSIDSPWTQTTDADGWATFTGLPRGYQTDFEVADDRYADTDGKYRVTLANAPSTPDLIMTMPGLGYAISGTVKYIGGAKPAKGVSVRAYDQNGHGGDAVADASGNFVIKRLPAGLYQVTVSLWQPREEWVAAPASVVLSKADVDNIDLVLTHGALVVGNVTAKGTGKPAAGVNIYTDQQVGWATSDAGGKFSMRVPPGKLRIMANSPGVTQGGYDGKDIDAVDGKTITLSFQVVPPKPSFKVSGIVVDPAGKPVADAQIDAFSAGSGDAVLRTDAHGRFTTYSPMLAGSTICARKGTLSTAKPAVVTGDFVKLKIVPGALISVDGIVKDQDGKPVPNAKVSLYHEQSQMGSEASTAITDKAGKYTMTSQYGGVDYMVGASPVGYENGWSKQVTAGVGKTLTFPPITVVRADSFIAGTVVDPKGNPIEGASVRDMQQSSLDPVLTDKQGRFRLDGVSRKNVELSVNAPGGRWASVGEPSGVDNVVIKAQTTQEEYAESERFGKLMKADHTNHGNGENALKLLKADEVEASTSGRKVFLIFHASWCGPCFMLHRFINDPKVKPILDSHFVVQELDIWEHEKNGWENPGGADLYKKYGKVQGVPFFVILDANGKKLGDSTLNGDNYGVPTEGAALDEFLRTLKSAAPSLTDSQMSTLRSEMKVASTF